MALHAAERQLAMQPQAVSPPSKLNLVSFAGKSQANGSPAGPRIPAGQPRKWLRIDEHGKSAFIKVQTNELLITYTTALTCLRPLACTGGKTPVSRVPQHSIPRLAYPGSTGRSPSPATGCTRTTSSSLLSTALAEWRLQYAICKPIGMCTCRRPSQTQQPSSSGKRH